MIPGSSAPEFLGTDSVVRWFGRWPSFHDAEVRRIDLARDGVSRLVVETWVLSGDTDEGGAYVRDRLALVTFHMERVSDAHLDGFGPQNVISRLDVERDSGGVVITLHPCYGVHGSIRCEDARVDVEPLSATKPVIRNA